MKHIEKSCFVILNRINIMNKLFNLLFHHPGHLLSVAWRYLGRKTPDELYLRVHFRLLMGKRLNLKDPQTFSEKLQWLKLYDRRPEYIKMVDKAAVKDYVAGIIGGEYIIPTLGVWDKPEDINWDNLPNQFVLKCTHDSGGLVICRDKTSLDKKAAIKKLRKSLKRNYFKVWREWPYKDVPRQIIAEKYIEPDPDLQDLPDYKFFCFNGEPRYCQVISGRNETMSIDFFDMDWNHQPFHEPKNYPFAEVEPQRPVRFEQMKSAAKMLAQDRSFSRIDFYQVGGVVYFGEITFFPTSGMGGFEPNEYDLVFGRMMILPHKRKQ